jgi:hypothetical protein
MTTCARHTSTADSPDTDPYAFGFLAMRSHRDLILRAVDCCVQWIFGGPRLTDATCAECDIEYAGAATATARAGAASHPPRAPARPCPAAA